MEKLEGMFDVAIVGGGASGTLVALQLLRRASAPLRLAIVERGPLARGLAYSTRSPLHLLNVPARNMSALPESPDDFVRWMASVAPGVGPEDFAERRCYGPYLESRLLQAAARPGHSLEIVQGQAERLRSDEAAISIDVDGDRELRARKVVLALGHSEPRPPAIATGDLIESRRFVRSPWSADAIDGRWKTLPVLLLGTGLTMVDTVLALVAQGHVGGAIALSRHGLLPRPHAATAGPAAAFSLAGIHTVSAATRLVRGACDRSDWRAVFDLLRPWAATFWSGLPLVERRRFLRHLRAWWDAHRHRMAPAVAARIAGLRQEGLLRIQAGRLVALRLDDDRVEASLRPRGSKSLEILRFGHVINCIGPDPHAVSPLVTDLLHLGLATPGPLGMGLATDGAGALLGRHGTPSARLFTLGPLRRGELWETTAIPELREQALQLAGRLLEDQRAPKA